VAYRSDKVEVLPVKLRNLKVKTRNLQYIYIRCQGETAIHRRPSGDIWQGLWEPFLIENAPVPQMNGVMTLVASQVKHVLSHRILLADFYLLDTDHRPSLPEDYIWIKEENIEQYAVPRLIDKLITKLRR
jgi:A/G-specific adenine glycosylase